MTTFSKPSLSACLAMAKSWGLAILWMFLIFLASADSQSVARTSRIIGPFCRWLFPNVTFNQVETVQYIVRKASHMTEYAVLAVLLLYALAAGKGDARKWISPAWVLAVAYASADEFHQLFVTGRNASVVDVMIDAAGAALGLCLAARFLRRRERDAAVPAAPGSAPADPTTLAAAAPEPHPAQPRPSYADQILYTLEGQDFENRTRVHLSVQDRLQREHGGRLILGRNGEAAQLCLKNTSVSGRHLAITFRSGQFEIEDLGSSNGTRVNGRRLTPQQPALLADGDRIEAGEVLLHFRRLA
ncbi:MAG: VanZ family protein [Chthoniobacteraceae bacterium]|nr:VanZ family protein [Chthoniobacteraceae bacterium]